MERIIKIYIYIFLLNTIFINSLYSSNINEVKFVEIKVLDKVSSINSKLILEVGHRQNSRCSKILKENGYYINQISKDLSGKDRCVVSTKL